MAKAKRKRLVRGRDWHGWGYVYPKKIGDPEKEWLLCYCAYELRPSRWRPAKAKNVGKWVRVKLVKFVEVK